MTWSCCGAIVPELIGSRLSGRLPAAEAVFPQPVAWQGGSGDWNPSDAIC